MPGQQKRRRRQQDATRRAAARFAPDAGHWRVVFETRDETTWRNELDRLRTADPRLDETALRIDTLCGRLTQPTTYRVSRWVPNAP